MIKFCIICEGKFSAPPSSKTSTCSPSCRSERAKKHASEGRAWSADAKKRLAAKGKTKNLKLGTAAAIRSPIAGPFETNQEAKVWDIVNPRGDRRTIRNLKRTLINELGAVEGLRVSRLLKRMAAVMTAGGEAWITRCGWTLNDLPIVPED